MVRNLVTFFISLVGVSLMISPASAVVISTPLSQYEDTNRDPTSVPHTLGAGDGKFFARFDVPSAQSIVSLNSFRVFVTVNDDGDGGGESANVFLGAGAGEILLGAISNPPNSATVFSFDVLLADFAAAIASIQNNDRVPIQLDRTGGDMVVQEITIEVDAVLAAIPEPGTPVVLLTGGLLMAWVVSRRRFRSS